MRPTTIWLAAAAMGTGCGASKMAEAPASAAARGELAAEAAPAEGEAAGTMLASVAEQASLTVRRAAPESPDLNRATDPQGFAVVREFPAPTARAEDGARTDFRDTIHWDPIVRTDAAGRALVRFRLSDAVTGFRATAEGVGGGQPGHGEALLPVRLPLAVAATLPTEVATGDRLRFPVTVDNGSATARRVEVVARLGGAFAVRGGLARSVWVPAHAARRVTFVADVVGVGGPGEDRTVELAAASGLERDLVRRELAIAPRGIARTIAAAGKLERRAEHVLDVPASARPGATRATLRLYPSPAATLIAGTEALLREPGGCFEQASSANYPNVMVMKYLATGATADAELAARTRGTLERGYALLAGYESPTKGFEWFGGDPGHEALTAYGLMEFRAMAEVFPGVDRGMVERTAAWLKTRRDGQGGFQRNARALDSFGAASPEVTNAYVAFALSEAGEAELGAEQAAMRKVASTSRDPYVLALAVGALANLDARDPVAREGARRLVELQVADGHFAGADHSITRSGGHALEIEATALAVLALLRAGDHDAEVGRGAAWLTEQRSGGLFASTQATVLALQALSELAARGGGEASGSVAIWIDGAQVGEVEATPDGGRALEVGGLEAYLTPGRHVLRLTRDGDGALPYDLAITMADERPASSPAATVAVTTALDRGRVRVGRAAHLTATIVNSTDRGLPMVIARLGIPGGLGAQTWQLDELRKRGTIDFYETRAREVIVYFRAMKPRERRVVPVELLAAVPGDYAGPPSAAYLYYTDEHRSFAPALAVTITAPAARRKHHVTR